MKNTIITIQQDKGYHSFPLLGYDDLHAKSSNICIQLCRARRAAKEAKEAPSQPSTEKPRVDIKQFVKIGRPGYKVTKQRDPENGQQSLLFQVRGIKIAATQKTQDIEPMLAQHPGR